MYQIRIVEQRPVQDKDAYYSVCAYDQSEMRIKVTVTAQAIKDLNKFDCMLNEITQLAVEDALSRGQHEGELLVSTETPTFQRLIARFRTIKQAKKKENASILST